MARVYVSLDIETTGLDPEQDEIIEIGAIRFKGSRVYETYSTLVAPTRPIPYKIQHVDKNRLQNLIKELYDEAALIRV